MRRIAPSVAGGLSAGRLPSHPKVLWLVAAITTIGGACRDRGPHEDSRALAVAVAAAGTSATAAQILAAVQAQTGSPVQPAVAQSFTSVSGGLAAQFPAAATAATKRPATVVLPQAASAAMSVKDTTSGASVSVSLAAALPVPAQTVGGFVIYPAALASGAAVLHRVTPEGTEDFVYFPVRPPSAEVDYAVSFAQGVAGLRLVESGLELLDATGAPRLRVEAPYLVGATGARVDGTLAVSGCAVDSDPSAPWGRSVTAPGSSQCTLQVTWPDSTVTYPAILDPRWTTTGSMVTARQGHTATLLSTGKVLVVGGTSNGTTALRSAELYDPTSGTWAATASMPSGQQRWRHTATQLKTGSNGTTSGKVLIAGGFDGSFTTSRCELYSPSAGTWSAATSLDRFRQAHVATLLADGKVFVSGGQDDTGLLATASVYDPSFTTGGWSPSDDLPSPIISHQAVLLTTSNSQLSNKVLVFGGNNGTATLSSVYLYDEVTDTNSTLASMPSAREGHTATVLPNGNVLVTGGKSGSSVLGTTVVFNPSTGSGSWSSAGTMNTARQAHTATLLSTSIVTNGTVLVAGGNSGSATLSSAELWDGNATWTATTALPFSTQGQSATALGNRLVLIAGGVNGSTTLNSAALYDASFGVGCTSNSQCATGFCVSGVCCDTACTGTCGSCNLPGHVGTCSPVGSGTICRDSVGTCDLPETCDGSSTVCPADSVVASGTLCRGSAGACDVPETCTGSSGVCPADAFAASGTTCRGAVGSCDVAETCSGTSAACPSDTFVAAGTVCRASAGSCDVAETCSGTSGSCPDDSLQPSSTVCRASAGTCDVAENCSGSSADCPADDFQPLGTVCRASAGACDATETCTGQAADCPPDGYAPSTTVCRAAAGPCDVAETCTGGSIACPGDSLAANGTACTDGNQCVTGKTCQVGQCTGGDSTPCSGSGANTTASVSSSGGSVSLETTSVTFSPGAFTDNTGVTVTSTTTTAPTGVLAYSPTYKFTPDGAQFTQPVTVSFVVGLGLNHPTIMWSRPGGGWDDLGGTYANGIISGTVTHFSEGLVADSQCAGQSDGTSCTDGDACTTETCQGELCTHVSEVTCTSADKCHAAACDPAVGCTSRAVADGTLCDDGTITTQGHICQAGVCGPVAIQNLTIDEIAGTGGVSGAQAVNATGQVVGYAGPSASSASVYLWTPPGPLVDLGLASGTQGSALSNSGFISGVVQVDQSRHPFVISPDHQYTDLGPLGDDQPMVDPNTGVTVRGAYGWAVNDTGQVAGPVITGGQYRGFLYTPGQPGWVDIGDLGQRSTWATAIAADGTVIGSSQLPDSPATTFAHLGHAVMYRDGILIDLNDYLDPTTGATLVYADGISDKYIVGTAFSAGGAQVPFRFNRATEVVELLPTTWAGLTFTGKVNNAGEVVGFGTIDAANTQQAAFLYSDQLGFRNLNDLIPANSGWDLQVATGINDSGDIVGSGSHNGVQRAFRLRVSPETIACQGQAVNPSPVCIWVDGVVQDSGHLVALFGYRNAGATTVEPALNQEVLNGQEVTNPLPAPPQVLIPGDHPGAFLPTISASDTVSWTIDGQTVQVNPAFARQLDAAPFGWAGTGLEVEDTLVALRQDTSVSINPTLLGIATVGSLTKAVFTYTANVPANAAVPYGPGNCLIDDSGQCIADPDTAPPTWFAPGTHGPFSFVVTGDTLTWTIGGNSATAVVHSTQLPLSQQLPLQTLPDGSHLALLPGNSSIDVELGASEAALTQGIVPSEVSFTAADAANDAALAQNGETPIGPTSPGTMSGTFDVSDDGAAEYTVPVQVPPGRNGIQPKLSIVYNSRAGTGMLGPGWSLRGLHRIERCRRPYGRAQDEGADSSPITFTVSDDLCLDGEQLVAVPSAPLHQQYRTKNDQLTLFTVTSSDALGPLTIEALRKDGLIDEYGLDTTSRDEPQQITGIDVNARAADNSTTLNGTTTQKVRRAWYLSKTTDRFGNWMSVSYDSIDRIVPHSISYTGNDTTGRAPTNAVVFSYTTILDPNYTAAVPKYSAGVKTQSARFLTTITTIAPNPYAAGVIQKYEFTYETPSITHRALLTRVQACDGSNVCMAPTVFGWEPGSLSFRDAGQVLTDYNCGGSCNYNLISGGLEALTRNLVVADFNGDGRQDLLYRAYADPRSTDQPVPSLRVRLGTPFGFDNPIDTGAQTVTDWAAPMPLATDIDGDGRSDFILPEFSNTSGASVTTLWDFYRADGEVAFTRQPPGLSSAQYHDATLNPEAVNQSRSGARLFTADLDGNGLSDVIRDLTLSDGQPYLGYRLNSASGLADYLIGRIASGPFAQSPVPWTPVFSIDLDGDGRQELVLQSNDTTFGVHVGPSGLSGLATNFPLPPIPNQGAGFQTFLPLDANGDGLTDFVRYTYFNLDNDPGPAAYVWLNTGKGFLPVSAEGLTFHDGQVADMNGDGLDDVVSTECDGNPMYVHLSWGDGRFQAVPLSDLPPAGTLNTGGVEQPMCRWALLDVNGDGMKDIVQAAPPGDGLELYLRNSPKPDRIVHIQNGIGATASITYTQFNGTEGDLCAYPHACAGRNVDVVAGYTVDEGQVVPGQAPTTRYTMRYVDARADALGEGWLGFDIVERTNARTLVTHRKTFDLNTRIGNWYPYVGRPVDETVTIPLLSSGRTITRTTHTVLQTIQTDPLNALGPYVVVPSEIDQIEQEQDPGQGVNEAQTQRSIQKKFTYDEWGNVKTDETIGNITGSDDVVTYSVSNDTERWLIGKVSRVDVTSYSAATAETATRNTVFDVDPGTGAVTRKTIAAGDSELQLTVAYSRNPDGLVSAVTETPIRGEVRTVATTYDTLQGALPATSTNALGQVTSLTYHPGLGVLVGKRDVNGNDTLWQYDTFGRVRGQADATGYTNQVHYSRPESSSGVIKSWTDSTSRGGSATYDDLGREVSRSETAFDGTHVRTTTTAYDAISRRPGSVSRPFGAVGGSATGAWALSYDEAGRLISSQAPGEAKRTITYERLVTTEFVDGTETGYRVDDGMGHIVQSANVDNTSGLPNGAILTTYDVGPFGKVRRIHEAGGGVLSLEYDPLGHVRTRDDPDSGVQTVHYNSFGEAVSVDSPGQPRLVYSRDRLGRVFEITSGEDHAVFQWDTAANGIGRLAQTTGLSGIANDYRYQRNGLLQSSVWTVDGEQFGFNWQYDTSGRLNHINYPTMPGGEQVSVTLGYGGDGRPGVTLYDNAGTSLWSKDAVADDGQSAEESFGDGLGSTHDIDWVTGRLTRIATGYGGVLVTPGGRTYMTALQDLGYSYDTLGRLGTRTDYSNGAVESFSYDNLDRVSDWTQYATGTTVHYAYDPSGAGNLTSRTLTDSSGVRTSETFTYDQVNAGPHAVTAGPLGTYGYDEAGRQTSRPGQPAVEYTYFNLPRRIARADGGEVDFRYDAMGVRVVKSSGGSTTVSIAGLYERRITNGVVSHVVYVPGDGAVVGQIVCDAHGACDSPTYFHQDNLGTIDLATKDGVAVGRQKRDPFGRAYAMAGILTTQASDLSVGFAGQSEDAETGLVNLNHRLYDPQTGRFVSPDPLVKNLYHGQDLNRYTYCANNPLAFVDPSGLQTADPTELAPIMLTPMAGNDGDVLNSGASVDDGFGPPSNDLGEPVYTDIFSPNGRGGFEGDVPGQGHVTVTPIFLPVQVADPETPGQGPVASSAVSQVPVPRLEEVVVNTVAVSVVAPVTNLLRMTGPGAARFDLNEVRPFAYSPSQVEVGAALEMLVGLGLGEVGGLLDAGDLVAAELPGPAFPPNFGFLGETERGILEVGQIIDRYGGAEMSEFFSPQGTSAEARSLPPNTDLGTLRTFEVLKPFSVESGTAAPYWGQSGGGIQYRSEIPLGQLLAEGYLKEL